MTAALEGSALARTGGDTIDTSDVAIGHMSAGLWCLALAVLAALIADALKTRRRLQALELLDPAAAAPAPEALARYRFVPASGDGVGPTASEALFAAAVAHAEANALAAVELWPEQLDARSALGLAFLVDPQTFRGDPLARGWSAGLGTVIRHDVWQRAAPALEEAEVRAPWASAAARRHRAVAEFKRCAPRAMAYVVAPGSRGASQSPEDARVAWGGVAAQVRPGVRALQLGFLLTPVGFAAADWAVGLGLLLAFAVQPWLALTGTSLRPSDLAFAPLVRWQLEVATALAAWLLPPADADGSRAAADAADRAAYAERVAGGLGPFFEPPRRTCPVCGGISLDAALTTGDLWQHKPGRFHLDRCRGCGTVFQNPRLSLAGLDYYYADFYAGRGEAMVEGMFAATDTSYLGRVEQVARLVPQTPRAWLDVGGGHGHFCLVAGAAMPDTRFDILDLGEAPAAAVRRGWAHGAHEGLFVPAAAEGRLGPPGAYDVVSMHHYLEHTREPAEELRAAASLLAPGGHLLIEVPDPRCTWGRRLGRLWLPWFQPQHQHLIPPEPLSRLLRDAGFEPVEVELGAAHQAVDLGFAGGALSSWWGPEVGQPWRPPPRLHQRLRHLLAGVTTFPLVVLGFAIDRARARSADTPGRANTFRLLARRVATR